MRVSNRLIVLFLVPATFLYLAFFLIPTIWAFYYSLFDWSGIGTDMRFVGLGNFGELLNDRVFWLSMRNTMGILLIGGVIVFGLALALTMLINSGIRGKKVFRAIIFFPNIVATIALTTLWGYIYNPQFGLLSNFLNLIGLSDLARTPWLAPNSIFGAMLVALIWINVGFYMVLLMAGVDKIPIEYYEAAKLDGASQLQMFRRITIPLLWDVLTVGMVLWSIGALKIFEFPFSFTGLEPVQETYTVGVYLYVMGFGQRTPIYRLGYATAMGVLLLLAVVLIVLVVRRVMRREVVEY
jgi:ABC-type sugar transport system permease subunit